MNRIRLATKAVIVRNNCFLLLERSQHPKEYDLPGGGILSGETPIQALAREIFEETGLTVQIKQPLKTWNFSEKDNEVIYGITYLARYLSGTIRLSDEHQAWRWQPFNTPNAAELPRWIREESALAAEVIKRESDTLSVTRTHHGIYAIIHQNDKILLIRKKRGPYTGLFDLPGGSPEPGESEEQTLARELTEETGCRLLLAQNRREEKFYFRGFTEDSGCPGGLFHTAVLFDCMVKGSPDGNISDLDSDGALWLNKNDLTAKNTSPLVIKALKLYTD